MSETSDAECLRNKLYLEWGYYDEDGDERVFVVVPKLPLIQAGYREPPFEATMWNGRVRRILERKL
jgi:hypothetical protein